MGMQAQGATISFDREYRQLIEFYRDELIDLADAAKLECECDDHFFWIVEQGVRIVFSLSSSGLAAASERIQQCIVGKQQ